MWRIFMPSYFKILQCMTMLQFGLQTLPVSKSALETIRVTLTLEVGTWVLHKTHHLDVVDICANLFKNSSMHDKVIIRTRMCVPNIANCYSVNLKNLRSVTLTFEEGTWFLEATQHCHVIDI
jgi:hypothetical protein